MIREQVLNKAEKLAKEFATDWIAQLNSAKDIYDTVVELGREQDSSIDASDLRDKDLISNNEATIVGRYSKISGVDAFEFSYLPENGQEFDLIAVGQVMLCSPLQATTKITIRPHTTSTGPYIEHLAPTFARTYIEKQLFSDIEGTHTQTVASLEKSRTMLQDRVSQLEKACQEIPETYK